MTRIPKWLPNQRLKQRDRHEHDQRDLRGRPEDLHVAAAGEVPAADAEHHRGAGGQPREDRVDEGVVGPVAPEQRPDARQHRLPVLDLVADRVLHERVRDEDEVGREPGADHCDPQRREMEPRREAVPAEDPEAEERRLEEEGGEALDRERRPEHVADELGVDRPVHPELELLDEAGRDADREVDQEQRPEEVRQPQPAPRLPVRRHMRLEDRDDRPQAEGQRHEQEVVDRGRRELRAGEVDRGGGGEDHACAAAFHIRQPGRIIQFGRNPMDFTLCGR